MKRNGLTLALALAVTFLLGVVLGPSGTFAASDQGYNGTTAKTADYTITVAESGTVFTNRADTGAIVFTLPAPFANAHYKFIVHANQSLTVAADAVDTLVTFNDATADSLAISTTNEKIGGVIEVWSDGTSWFAWGTSLLHTFTVNT